MSGIVATAVALMKEAEDLVEKINQVMSDKAIEGLTIEQEDIDVVYEHLDKLWVINSNMDLCDYLRPTLKRIESAELMVALRNELESIGVPRDDQLVLVPMGMS